jgi:hypothetical protein
MPPTYAHDQRSRCVVTKCTPTKFARLQECGLSFDGICQRSSFKHTTLHPKTLERDYTGVQMDSQTSANELFEALKAIWTLDSFKEYVIHVYQSFPHRLRTLKENDFSWVDY